MTKIIAFGGKPVTLLFSGRGFLRFAAKALLGP
jgi:hypothetical protein